MTNLDFIRSRTPGNRASRTHCPQGHPYSGENLYLRPDGKGRDCRICRRDAELRSRKRMAARRAACK